MKSHRYEPIGISRFPQPRRATEAGLAPSGVASQGPPVISLSLRFALVIIASSPFASAQGIFSKAIEQARRVADKESFGGELNFPDGVARFFDLGLNEITAAPAPVFQTSAGFVKWSDKMRSEGKSEPAVALTAKLNQLVAGALPQVAQLVRAGVVKLKLDSSTDFKAGRTTLVDALRKVVSPGLKNQLRAGVAQAGEMAGLPAAFDAFIAASGAKISDPKAALGLLVDQAAAQAIDHVFLQLAKQETAYRADPARATDKTVAGIFNTLK